MLSYRNTFSKLMNQDIGIDKHNPENYYELRNGRVVVNDGLSTGNITVERGNKFLFELPSLDGTLVAVGLHQTRDYLLIFSTGAANTSPTPSNTRGQIWRLKIDPVTKQIWNGAETALLPFGSMLDVDHLIYTNFLNFSTANRLDITSQYENNNVHKIYWVDGFNLLSHLNIAQDLDAIRATPLDQLTIVPYSALVAPKPTAILSGGQYKAGKVQYVYELFKIGGTKTVFSPLSSFVHLTEYSETIDDSRLYWGSLKGTDVGKSVAISISGLDTSFDGIRLIAIFYEDLDQEPEIRIIHEDTITSSDITITDSGNITLGTYSSQELNGLGSLLIYPKTVAIKDHILFTAGGVEEEYFDLDALYKTVTENPDAFYDARAYRWADSPQEFRIDGITYTDPASVPEKADCISSPLVVYKYNNVTGHLGGSGVHVSYDFQMARMRADIQADNAGSFRANKNDYQVWEEAFGIEYTNNPYLSNYASPINSGYIIGYTRDEIYAFAIVVRDARGRRSYPKWIADIRMPAMRQQDTKTTYTNGQGILHTDYALQVVQGSSNYLLALGINFKVDLSIFGDMVSGWEIVRMRRPVDDRTILDQGFLAGLQFPGSNNNYFPHMPLQNGTASLINSGQKMFEFSGPHSVFASTKFSYQEGDYLEIQAGYKVIGGEGLPPTTGTLDQVTWHETKLGNPIFPDHKETLVIEDGRLVVDNSESLHTIGGLRYTNYIQEFIFTWQKTGKHNSSFILSNNNNNLALEGLTNYEDPLVVISNYKRNLPNQYGGNTYTRRTFRNYISTNSYVSADRTQNTVFGGDTYVCLYDFRRISPRGVGPTGSENVIFPVESTINLDLRLDMSYSKIPTATYSDYQRHALQEFAGSYGEIGDFYDNYLQAYDLYLYNPVYSQESTIINYPAKPLLASSKVTYDSRIRNSGKKIYGELTDSWLSFLPDNKLDVQSNYGGITRLYNFKDRLTFVQWHGLGVASVNERGVVINTENDAELVLGSGGVLDSYVYISTKYGSRHQFSVESSDRALYYFDSTNKSIISYTGEGVGPLSTTQGMASWFRNNLNGDLLQKDNTLQRIGVHTGYDALNDRMLFTFLDNTITETISYSEYGTGFESFYDCAPNIYGSVDGLILSYDHEHKNQCYIHGEGDYGNFYNTLYDTTLTIMVNPIPTNSKVFGNVAYVQNTSLNGAATDSTFYKYEAWNQYQSTGEVDLIIDDNVKRKSKVRIWNFILGRDTLDSTSRLRDTYMFLKLYYSNDKNYKMTLQDILVYFLPHFR